MLEDSTQLRPIVERTLKVMYGDAAGDIRLVSSDLLRTSRKWIVVAVFSVGTEKLAVELQIGQADERVTSTREVPLPSETPLGFKK